MGDSTEVPYSAEDAVQDAIAHCLESGSEINSAYIDSIARSKLSNEWRRLRRRNDLTVENLKTIAETDAGGLVGEYTQSAAMNTCHISLDIPDGLAERLSPSMARFASMSASGMTDEEIAINMGKSDRTIRRWRQQLQELSGGRPECSSAAPTSPVAGQWVDDSELDSESGGFQITRRGDSVPMDTRPVDAVVRRSIDGINAATRPAKAKPRGAWVSMRLIRNGCGVCRVLALQIGSYPGGEGKFLIIAPTPAPVVHIGMAQEISGSEPIGRDDAVNQLAGVSLDGLRAMFRECEAKLSVATGGEALRDIMADILDIATRAADAIKTSKAKPVNEAASQPSQQKISQGSEVFVSGLRGLYVVDKIWEASRRAKVHTKLANGKVRSTMRSIDDLKIAKAA